MTASITAYPVNQLSEPLNAVVGVTGAMGLDWTASGKLHRCSGATGYAVTLPQLASSHEGEYIAFKFDGLTSGALVTLTGYGAENIVHGFKTANTRVYCVGEECLLYCAGTYWEVFHETLAPNPFEVYYSGTFSAANNSYVKIAFNTVLKDVNGYWDAVNTRWTPKMPGMYLMTGYIGAPSTALGDGDAMTFLIYKNSGIASSFFYWTRSSAAVNASVANRCIVSLNGTTDYVEGYVYQSTGAALPVGGAALMGTRMFRETS